MENNIGQVFYSYRNPAGPWHLPYEQFHAINYTSHHWERHMMPDPILSLCSHGTEYLATGRPCLSSHDKLTFKGEWHCILEKHCLALHICNCTCTLWWHNHDPQRWYNINTLHYQSHMEQSNYHYVKSSYIISSAWSYFSQKCGRIESVFLKLKYPRHFFNLAVKEFLDSKIADQHHIPSPDMSTMHTPHPNYRNI